MGSAAASKLAEGVKEASPAALQESAKDLSGEERSRIMSAIAILELAGGYAGSTSNGDWGDYSIRVQVKQDATATVSESACFFRDSPSEDTTHTGTCSVTDDILTFTAKETTTTSSYADEGSDKTVIIKFKIQGDGSLARLAEDGTIAVMQGGYDGEKVPAILKRKKCTKTG
ncbi:unnamed protein product [Symbiodinium sp. CCMP2592]|nr:unnamed protein product [Symbiodinium sp. CCMP2592]